MDGIQIELAAKTAAFVILAFQREASSGLRNARIHLLEGKFVLTTVCGRLLRNGRRCCGGCFRHGIRYIALIVEPPGEKGIGFLQYDYEEAGRDSDQWIYLSALGKVKRIASGSEDEPKTGSFFGSEFSYEDMEQRDLEDYTYKILQSETYRKRATWVLQTIPVPERARKSNYSKSLMWIDKEHYMVLKSILYDRQGKRVKRLIFRAIEVIDGIRVARRISVNNLLSRRRSLLEMTSISYNISISDDFLTQRTLTDGAFRESRLGQLRALAK